MKKNKNNRGFLQIIALIIIVVVILIIMGVDLKDFWNNILYPAISTVWEVIYFFADILVKAIKAGWEALTSLIGIVKK